MAKFDWSLLDRNMIINHMLSVEPKVIKSNIPVDKFHQIIGNHIKKLVPVKIKKHRKCHEFSNTVFVGGTYYSDLDYDKEKCIEILFEYSFFDEEIYISTRKFLKISKLVADTLLHEIIHMHQHRSRKFKLIPEYKSKTKNERLKLEQEYLGCPDEMDAYSFNIACELVDFYGKDLYQISSFLNSSMLSRKKISPSWNKYFRAFEKNQEHPIIKKMKRQIIKYVPAAVQGKPYKKNELINR